MQQQQKKRTRTENKNTHRHTVDGVNKKPIRSRYYTEWRENWNTSNETERSQKREEEEYNGRHNHLAVNTHRLRKTSTRKTIFCAETINLIK